MLGVLKVLYCGSYELGNHCSGHAQKNAKAADISAAAKSVEKRIDDWRMQLAALSKRNAAAGGWLGHAAWGSKDERIAGSRSRFPVSVAVPALLADEVQSSRLCVRACFQILAELSLSHTPGLQAMTLRVETTVSQSEPRWLLTIHRVSRKCQRQGVTIISIPHVSMHTFGCHATHAGPEETLAAEEFIMDRAGKVNSLSLSV